MTIFGLDEKYLVCGAVLVVMGLLVFFSYFFWDYRQRSRKHDRYIKNKRKEQRRVRRSRAATEQTYIDEVARENGYVKEM